MNDFDDRDALRVLLKKLESAAPELKEIVLEAIDAGKEVPIANYEGKRKRDHGSRTERLTDGEALAVALDVLHSYFVELPRVIQSAERNLRFPVSRVGDDPGGAFMSIEIEQRTAERFSEGEEFWPLRSSPEALISEQASNLDALFQMTGAERELPWQR